MCVYMFIYIYIYIIVLAAGWGVVPLVAGSRTLLLNIACYDGGWVNFELKPLEGARLPAPPVLGPALGWLLCPLRPFRPFRPFHISPFSRFAVFPFCRFVVLSFCHCARSVMFPAFRFAALARNTVSAIPLSVSQAALIGTKDCTTETDTSEIILDLQWHSPMDVQLYFPTYHHASVVLSYTCPSHISYNLYISQQTIKL